MFDECKCLLSVSVIQNVHDIFINVMNMKNGLLWMAKLVLEWI